MQSMNLTDILQIIFLWFNFLIYRKQDLLGDNFPTNFCLKFLNHWCMHTEGKEQFITNTVGQLSLESCTMWPISQGAPSAAGQREQRCPLQHQPPPDNGDQGPSPPRLPPAPVQGRIKRRWSSCPSTESSQSHPTGTETNSSVLFNK